MQKFLILLLVYLLPLQGFADRQVLQSEAQMAQYVTPVLELIELIDQNTMLEKSSTGTHHQDEETEGSTIHADFIDEHLPVFTLVFSITPSSLIHILDNDKARQPPFLPPAAPPPET